jgi:sugar phosphate isomerase/epimerase
MTAPIAVQLYSLREAAETNFEATIRRIAAMGYAGVETAGQYGGSPRAARALFDSLGLKVAGAHSPLPIGDNRSAVLDTLHELGAPVLVFPWIDPQHFRSIEGIQRVADQLNEANAVAQKNGLRLLYHNHDFEFIPLPDGSIPHHHLQQLVAPTVGFEIDTYWVKVAESDPAEVVRSLGTRAPLLHIKDGQINPKAPMLPIGEGAMDFPPIIAAAHADWLIVEFDQCATDIFEAVEKSLRYLVGKGLGHGK